MEINPLDSVIWPSNNRGQLVSLMKWYFLSVEIAPVTTNGGRENQDTGGSYVKPRRAFGDSWAVPANNVLH